jgi:integrase
VSQQVIELLRSLFREDGNPYLFVGRDPGTHLGANVVTEALRRAGRRETTHGMRSAFSDWAHERTSFPGIIIELSLAHRVGTAVENAYRRTDLTDMRRELMEQWSKYCTTPPVAPPMEEGKVLPMRRRA